MKIHTRIPDNFITHPVVTIGMFDGLHKGHLHLLNLLNHKARLIGGESVVITFWPHPAWVINEEEQHPHLLLSREQKLKRFQKTGVDHVIELDFTIGLSQLSASDFIKKLLLEKLKASHLILGFNNRFGNDRIQDIGYYRELGKQFGLTVEKAPSLEVHYSKVSSTIIRSHIYNGDMWLASEYLGYYYSLKGIVVGGKNLGEKMGFPTANLQVTPAYKVVPMDGVYATYVSVGKKQYQGVLNIGYNPTTDKNNRKRSIEAHIIGFNQDIYETEIEVSFVKRIRDEMAFNSLSELVRQIEEDIQTAKTILTDFSPS